MLSSRKKRNFYTRNLISLWGINSQVDDLKFKSHELSPPPPPPLPPLSLRILNLSGRLSCHIWSHGGKAEFFLVKVKDVINLVGFIPHSSLCIIRYQSAMICAIDNKDVTVAAVLFIKAIQLHHAIRVYCHNSFHCMHAYAWCLTMVESQFDNKLYR